jgi:hypothetical protein
MFVGIHSKKLGWKKSKELSETVEHGGEVVRMALLKALVMSGRPPRIRYRLQKEFLCSTSGLSEELAKFKGGENVEDALLPTAPPWLVELSRIFNKSRKRCRNFLDQDSANEELFVNYPGINPRSD